MPTTVDAQRVDVADLPVDIHRCYQIDLTEHARPTTAARAWTRNLLSERVTSRQLDDILLILSELITNAEAHGSGATCMRIDSLPRLITVWVFDRDSGCENVRPRPAMPSGDAEGGRGLPLVENLATCWFTWPHTLGKAVAAVIHLGTEAEKR